MAICHYGCGLTALYTIGKKDTPCCSKRYNDCISFKIRSTGYAREIRHCSNPKCYNFIWVHPDAVEIYCGSSCAAIVNNAIRDSVSRTKQRITVKQTLLKKYPKDQGRWFDYVKLSKFKITDSDYARISGFENLEQYGWWHPMQNKTGLAHDHMFSVHAGFHNSVPAETISHPANCRLIQQSENSSKGIRCVITLEELHMRIAMW